MTRCDAVQSTQSSGAVSDGCLIERLSGILSMVGRGGDGGVSATYVWKKIVWRKRVTVAPRTCIGFGLPLESLQGRVLYLQSVMERGMGPS